MLALFFTPLYGVDCTVFFLSIFFFLSFECQQLIATTTTTKKAGKHIHMFAEDLYLTVPAAFFFILLSVRSSLMHQEPVSKVSLDRLPLAFHNTELNWPVHFLFCKGFSHT